MATCGVCKQPMLTEWPHVHAKPARVMTMSDSGRLLEASVAEITVDECCPCKMDITKYLHGSLPRLVRCNYNCPCSGPMSGLCKWPGHAAAERAVQEAYERAASVCDRRADGRRIAAHEKRHAAGKRKLTTGSKKAGAAGVALAQAAQEIRALARERKEPADA